MMCCLNISIVLFACLKLCLDIYCILRTMVCSIVWSIIIHKSFPIYRAMWTLNSSRVMLNLDLLLRS
jgi:hypothetical protein